VDWQIVRPSAEMRPNPEAVGSIARAAVEGDKVGSVPLVRMVRQTAEVDRKVGVRADKGCDADVRVRRGYDDGVGESKTEHLTLCVDRVRRGQDGWASRAAARSRYFFSSKENKE
jgi:hypothetical protein